MILYKINSFNDVSWWECFVDRIDEQNSNSFAPETFRVIRRWGHRLPISETNNTQKEIFATYKEAKLKQGQYIHQQTERRGYTTEIPTVPPSRPMLCQEYREPPDWSSFALQPKLDGIRCIMSEDGLRTRTNLELTSCPHLEFYSKLLPPGIKLDGELYIDNTPMNVIESYVMRKTPAKQCYEHIVYNVFDIIDTEAPFVARIEEVERIIQVLADKYHTFRTDKNLKMSETHPFFSIKFPFRLVETQLHEYPLRDETVQDYFRTCIINGYEGCIVRRLEGTYEINKRSSDILKLKEFFDDEFKIIAVLPGKNKCGILHCVTSTGETFDCSFRGTTQIRQHMLQYPSMYIGKWLKVEHEGFFDNGRPRCPIGIHHYTKKDHD